MDASNIGSHDEYGPIISSYCGEHVSPEKLKFLVPTVKKNTVLDNGTEVEDESNTPVGHRKCKFWKTSINDQRPKLRVCMNGIFVDG